MSSSLRQRMHQDLQLADHFHTVPDWLSRQQVRGCFLQLKNDCKFASAIVGKPTSPSTGRAVPLRASVRQNEWHLDLRKPLHGFRFGQICVQPSIAINQVSMLHKFYRALDSQTSLANYILANL